MKEKEIKPKYNMWQNTSFMLKNAWNVCKSVPFLCIVVAFIAAGKTISEMLIAPIILAKVETAAPISELITTILIFCGTLFLLSGLKGYLDENIQYGRVAVRTDILKQIGDKMARTSYSNILDTGFIDAKSKAKYTCQSNRSSAEYIWTTLTDILTNILGFIVYLTLLSGLNPLLFVVVIATTIISYFINKHINGWGYRHKEESSAFTSRLYYLARASMERSHAKDIRIFGLKDWLNDLWNSTFNLYEAFLAKREKIYLLTHIVDLCLAFVRNGVAYIYLIWLTLSGGLSAAEFLLYFSAITGFTQWITGILDKFSELHKHSLELSVLRDFLEWPEPFKFEEGIPLTNESSKNYEIVLENVTFRYAKAENDTLTNINLTIHPGEKLAIVGLNGAGKTTLVKLICGFLDPTEGRVLLNGEDIRTFNRRDYYALFSAVFQDFSLLEASVAENVAQCVDNIDYDKVWSCLELSGLTEKITSLPDGIHAKLGRKVYEDGVELSGGQTQRLMLARALYKNGPILALDEPTAALDPIAENDIYLKYNEMTNGRTALFISHRLASTRFCDRILFLEDGRIAEEGTHDSLIARAGGYADLFEVQSQYYEEGGEQDGEQ